MHRHTRANTLPRTWLDTSTDSYGWTHSAQTPTSCPSPTNPPPLLPHYSTAPPSPLPHFSQTLGFLRADQHEHKLTHVHLQVHAPILKDVFFSLITSLYPEPDRCYSMPCQNGGTCITELGIGSYKCQCEEGFRGTNCEGALLRIGDIPHHVTSHHIT